MSIRQIRLNSADQIKARIGEFRGKRLQVVLRNNTAVFGEVKSVDTDGIVLENRRMKENKLSFNEISEIFFDQIV